MDKNKEQCSICEKELDRKDLEYLDLTETVQVQNEQGEMIPSRIGPTYYACQNCATLAQMKHYKDKYFQAKGQLERVIIENNTFRTLLLRTETMQKIGEQGEIEVRSYIRQRRAGWESLPLGTINDFLELYQAHAQEFAQILNRQASKEEIKAHLERQTKERTAKFNKDVETTKKKNDEKRARQLPQTPEQRIIAQFMKIGMTEIQAKAQFEKMMSQGHGGEATQ